MDASPLVQAHEHAQAAAKATRDGHTAGAIQHHSQAADLFARAIQQTSSADATRTLQILHQHHRRLADLLQAQPLGSSTATATVLPPRTEPSSSSSSSSQEPSPQEADSSSEESPPPNKASLGQHRTTAPLARKGPVPADHGLASPASSIASNLAQARGIRASKPTHRPRTQDTKGVSTPDAQSSLPSLDKEQARSSPAPTPTQTQQTQELVTSSATDPSDGYTRFYNTFGNIINRISAPLAFAGLPLISEESDPPEGPPPSLVSKSAQPHAGDSRNSTNQTPRNRPATSYSPSHEANLAQIYSPATLRGVPRDPSESFYVVPTSGHTRSYASILSFAEKERRRDKNTFRAPETEEEDFFDAQEAPPSGPGPRGTTTTTTTTTTSSSPKAPRRNVASATGRPRSSDADVLQNRVQELTVENRHLKDMLDKLSRRLHAFEVSAQSSTLALAESFRFRQIPSASAGGVSSMAASYLMVPENSGSPTTMNPAALPTSTGSDAQVQVQALEKELQAMKSKVESLQKENKSLTRYREAWVQWKKAREKRQAEGAEKQGEQVVEPTEGRSKR